ncbi:YciI family protein [Rhodobacteraceae bacterium D3-12]|nr:YciI family protein [Rhodobacteraceae bacterium D3-12]
MPPTMATCVRVRGGKTETMDGPFAETKEQLGGYYMFDCKDLDEALHYAAMIPVAETGTIEVRPVMELPE